MASDTPACSIEATEDHESLVCLIFSINVFFFFFMSPWKCCESGQRVEGSIAVSPRDAFMKSVLFSYGSTKKII